MNNQSQGHLGFLLGMTFLLMGKPTEVYTEELPRLYIQTIAGADGQDYNGDNIPSGDLPNLSDKQKSALLSLPKGVAISSSGMEIYIADSGNHRIRKVDLQYGNISTVAGNGSGEYRGDGGLATNASLKSPYGIALSNEGRVYIADTGNHRIRMVDVDNSITTVAGSTDEGLSGDGGVATQAKLKDPRDVAVDSEGNVYIADYGNNLIRMVQANSGVITTIAGKKDAKDRIQGNPRSYDGDNKPALGAGLDPLGIALDGAGGLLVADARNHRIRRIDLKSGIITTVVGTGRPGDDANGKYAEAAELKSPSGVSVSSGGEIYIADTRNHRVLKVDDTGIVSTIAGTGKAGFSGDLGPAVEAQISNPFGIAVDVRDGVFIADRTHRVRRINMRKADAIEWKLPPRPRRWPYILGAVVLGATGVVLGPGGEAPDLPFPPKFPE
jgi:sugar lactone lactonase YvrE